MSGTNLKPQPRRLSRSALIGVVATCVDLVALHLLVKVVGLSPLAANVPSLVLGLGVQFVGNKYFAFQDTSPQILKQGGYFALIEVGALALNAGFFHLALAHIGGHHLIVRIVSSALVYFAYSYPLWHLIFKSPSDRGEAA